MFHFHNHTPHMVCTWIGSENYNAVIIPYMTPDNAAGRIRCDLTTERKTVKSNSVGLAPFKSSVESRPLWSIVCVKTNFYSLGNCDIFQIFLYSKWNWKGKLLNLSTIENCFRNIQRYFTKRFVSKRSTCFISVRSKCLFQLANQINKPFLHVIHEVGGGAML